MLGARARAAALALVFVPLLAFAQAPGELPFPFVSQLKAEPAGFQVKLTWKDAPEAVARYLVYRSGQEITGANLAKARFLGPVGPGVQYFLDTPPDENRYFYAVLAQDAAGKTFATLIPFRNKTLEGVAAATPATEQQAAAQISDIQAAPASDGLQVTFRSSSQERDLLIFRSTAPIHTPEDLLDSASATQLDAGTTRTVVPGLPGIDYWFAVVDAGLYKVGTVPLVPGANVTTDPVQMPPGTGGITLLPPLAPRRAFPLPGLEISEGIQTGVRLPGAFPELPAPRKVSPATEKAIAALLASAPALPRKEMQQTVLTEDQTPSPDPGETQLQAIVKGPFLGGDAAEAKRELRDFLDVRNAKDLQARAHFYLGQVYYFGHQPRQALMEFLMADNPYYHESEAWKDACFAELEKGDAAPAQLTSPAFSRSPR